VTCDPQELLDRAACFACLSESDKAAAALVLLCRILNGDTPVGCQPVTNAQVYSGASVDPVSAFWDVVGGTASQVGNDVFLTGESITTVVTGVGTSGDNGTFNFTAIGGCLQNLNITNFFNPAPLTVGNLPALTFFGVTNGHMTSFTAGSSMPQVVAVAFQNCDNFGALAGGLNVSGLVNMWYLAFGNCPFLEILNVSGCVSLFLIEGPGSALNQTSIDNLMIELDTNGLSNGIINLSGGTGPAPSGAGAVAQANLISKGWTINL